MSIYSSSEILNIYFDKWDETNNGGFKSNQVSVTLLVKEGFEGNPILTTAVAGGTTSKQILNLKTLTKYQISAVQSNPLGNSSALIVNTATSMVLYPSTKHSDLGNDFPFFFSFGVVQPMWVLSGIITVFHLVLSGVGCGAIFALKCMYCSGI